MSKRNLFDELKAGIEEARQYELGKVTLRTHQVEEPQLHLVRQYPDTLDRLAKL